MKFTASLFAALISALTFAAAGPASAQECLVEADPWDLDGEAVVALYECIEGQMLAAYTKGDDEVAAAYRNWTVTSTRPAIAGPHGERFLQTFANDIAAEQYLKFAEEGVEMPVGSVLAKESFKVSKGVAKVGPLFIMTKVAEGEAPDAMDWVYSGVQPNGKPMKFKQAFCADCHNGFDTQDALGYPLEDVRVQVTN